MIPALDFAVLPPEVNSGRMYAGAGPGPMLATAAAWKLLAAELRLTAQGFGSALSELKVHWHGPTSTRMMAAGAPYVTWLDTTAGHAEDTAAKAEAAVAAYEAAFAATVPPAVVAANRSRLITLIATNILGQNTPAIAATEAEYAEMWAQDATAMCGYAKASSVAVELTPFDPPGQTTNPAAPAAQSAAVARAAAMPAGPFAPGSASDTTGLNGIVNAIFGTDTAFGQFLNSDVLNTIFMPAFYMPAKYLGTQTSLMRLSQPAAATATTSAGEGTAGSAAASTGSAGTTGNSVSARMGQSALVGPVSVPSGWTSPPSAPGPLVAPSDRAPIVVPASEVEGTPAIPLAGNMGVHSEDRAIPQYGFKPTFVARPPAAG